MCCIYKPNLPTNVQALVRYVKLIVEFNSMILYKKSKTKTKAKTKQNKHNMTYECCRIKQNIQFTTSS